jgi:hypothetical protein
MRTVPILVLLTGLALGLSACGGGEDGGSDAAGSTTATSPAPTATAPPTDAPTDPTPTGKPGTTTVTGVVSQGVEPGCVVLDAGGEQLLLVGAERGSTPDGARVTVTGTRTPGLVSTCQQGTPFEVASVEPAA